MILYLAVGTVLFPTISEFHSENQIEKIKNTTRLAERYISMVMVPPLVVIMVLVYPVISTIISSAFLPVSYALMTLCVYTFVFSINRPYATLIGGMNRPGLTTKTGLGICLVNIPLNFLFIPENGLLSPIGINGITGAAVATSLSVFVGFFGLRYYAKKLSGIKILQTHTPRHLIAGLIMAGVIYFLAYRTSLFPDINWYDLVFLAGVGLLVYIGVLILLREFKKQDFVFFLDIIHPHKMLKYVTSELKDKPKK
jgi:putative peptidoglycan lipid II flippase